MMTNGNQKRTVSVGYACLALGVKDASMKTCRLQGASPERLDALTAHNLNALEAMIRYNAESGIRLFRISSDLVPFGSHPAVSFEWRESFASRLSEIGRLIGKSSLRVSMHPGQYTVLNSTNAEVVARSIADLVYHERVLSALRTDSSHKIVLHIGGVSGNKKEALTRFRTNFAYLNDAVKSRLVIENDDRYFHIADVIETGHRLGIPVVFDNLHHTINGCGPASSYEWIRLCGDTWRAHDGRQKIHYSQQDEMKRAGAHSKTVRIREFLEFAAPLSDLDIMLEVKDKNLSAMKCALCLNQNGSIQKLEKQWRLYKYLVLEKNPSGYQAIRELLKVKSAYPAAEFFEIIEASLAKDENTGAAVNAAEHVWGYLKGVCTIKERAGFEKFLGSYQTGRIPLSRMKSFLQRLSVKYQMTYLLDSYYFIDGIC